MDASKWSPADVVAWLEEWRGRAYIAIPVRVIEDTDDGLVVYVAEGTRYSFLPGGWPQELEERVGRGRFTRQEAWPVPELPRQYAADA